MTDSTAPEPEHHFDAKAADHVRSFLDLWLMPDRDIIERIHADRPYDLRGSDLYQVLEQLAYAKKTRHQLAGDCDSLRGQNADLHAQLDAIRNEPTPQKADLDSVYRERAELVALLAALYPSTWGIDPSGTDWHIVYIQLPTGQASWHISPTDVDLFLHVHGPAGDWDGHTTEEKYQRIRALIAEVSSR